MRCKHPCPRCCCCRNRVSEPTLVLDSVAEAQSSYPVASMLPVTVSEPVVSAVEPHMECSSGFGDGQSGLVSRLTASLALPQVCQRRRRPAARETHAVQPLPLLEDEREDLQVSSGMRTPGGSSESSGFSLQELDSCSQVANATIWLQRYENACSLASSSSGDRLIQMSLLASTFHNFCPLISCLTPKVELPKNLKRMIGGRAISEADVEGSFINIRELHTSELRDGLQWSFFEVEFVVMCLVAILYDIKESSGIHDSDTKAEMLTKVEHFPKSQVNNTCQKMFADVLQLHQQRRLSSIVAASLKQLISTSMSVKLKSSSMSQFLSRFDFRTAEEWRKFVWISAALCDRLRADLDALFGQHNSTVPDKEKDKRKYDESYSLLRAYAAGSNESTWWRV